MGDIVSTMVGVNKKGAKNQKIINAAETCPTKAIIVDDLEENQRIYPY